MSALHLGSSVHTKLGFKGNDFFFGHL